MIGVKRGNNNIPACVRFGLDVSKLEIEELFRIRIYRRLFNIVANDQTSSMYEFRPNLIKELYFLLQITPFIEVSLRESFLEKVEEWYNSNDHKKISLSKKFDPLVANLCSKSMKTGERPKSGGEWDVSINSFLRPYTAKLRKNIQENSSSRPGSSKLGVSSTIANTLDGNKSPHNKYISENEDVEEEWERTQDFKQKFRTLHPEEEPTYEKLINLIQRANNKEFYEDAVGFDSGRFATLRRPKTSISKKTSFHRSENMADEAKAEEEEKEKDEKEEENQWFGFEVEEEDENTEKQSEAEFFKNRLFINDQRSRRQRKFHDKLLEMKVMEDMPPSEGHPFHRLFRQNLLENQNKVIANKSDDEYLKNHLVYTKNKTFLKKEIARKTTSKRLFEVLKKGTDRTYKPKTNNYVQEEQKCTENITIRLDEGVAFGATDPFYDEKEFFTQKKREEVRRKYRVIKREEHEEVPKPTAKGLTKHNRFFSEKRFNPMHSQNVEDYNKEVLEDIEKIKSQMVGRNYISTGVLMKALHVDAPLSPGPPVWAPYQKRYLMVQKEPNKKKKTKKRKLKKSTKPR